MNKRQSKHLALFMAFAMVFSLVMAPSVYAADADMVSATVDAEYVTPDMQSLIDQAEANVVQPRSYYPSSGVTSGIFHGRYSTQAVYTNLPNGRINFSYSFYGGSTAYIRFYEGTGTNGGYFQKGPYQADNYTGSDHVYLGGGTYTVLVYNPNGSSTTQLTYAFNLY